MSHKNEVDSLLCEIKILSNIALHVNLVNMMGACTSDPGASGEIWMLLEYCEHGDLSSFMIKYQKRFQKSISETINKFSAVKITNRLLVKWAYHIAKGMEYLAGKQVMHGDLAARNILISGGGRGKDQHLVAKVADFGLSKKMYEKKFYKGIE